MSFLTQKMGGLPLWAWALIVGGGGLALAVVIKRQQSGGTSGASTSGASAAPSDPNIDPNTGVPYTIESQINPATGLPAYYGGPGVDPTTGTPTPSPTPTPTPTPTTGPTLPANPGNPGPTLQGGQPPTPAQHGNPPPAPAYQVVYARSWPTPDSSLWSIWQDHAHGKPWSQWEQEVLRENSNITNPNLIYPGQAIKIPV